MHNEVNNNRVFRTQQGVSPLGHMMVQLVLSTRTFRMSLALLLFSFVAACGQEWPISVRNRAQHIIEGFETGLTLDPVERSDGYRTVVISTGLQNTTYAAHTTRDWSQTAEHVATNDAFPVLGEFMVGSTVAHMSDPNEPGMWLKTHLVTEQRKGRLVFPQTARSVYVTLLPMDVHKTRDSQISYAAMRRLSVQMTTLPVLDVFVLP